jgi:DNA-directed RNA polymerase sigma subunit (sigma70/sigma32)
LTEAAQKLAAATGCDPERCQAQLKAMLILISKPASERGGTGDRAFLAFKLHQLFSGAGRLDSTLRELGISRSKVSQLKTVSIRPASLDAPISHDDSTELGETVGDEGAQTPFELLRDKNLRDQVSDLFEVLDDRERKIIVQRFGLDGGKPKTLEEVGKKFGVTRERIRQLQNIALAKLRRALSKKETPTYL